MHVDADPGTETTSLVIVLVDQTTIDGVEVVNAASSARPCRPRSLDHFNTPGKR